LRYNSLDTQTRSSGNRQRLMTLLEMPEEPTVSEVKLTDNGGLDRESFRTGTFFTCSGPIRKTAEAEARVVFENFDGGGTGGQRAISSKQPISWKRFVPMTPSARTCDFGSGGYSERVCRNSK